MIKRPSNQTNLQKIQLLLNNYQPNRSIVIELQSIKFILLTAPTAAGRNSVIEKLIEKGQYHYIVSDTTRPPRYNNGKLEKNGEVYWFKTEQDFFNSLKSGNYLEAAVIHNQQASGININELRAAKQNNKLAITDIDIVGCRTITSLSCNTLPLFLLPPDCSTWMIRIHGRGQLTAGETKRRLSSAKHELLLALSDSSYSFIINDILEDTVEKVHSIVFGNILLEDQKKARKKAKELLKNLN